MAWIVLAIGIVGGVGYALWQLKFTRPKVKMVWAPHGPQRPAPTSVVATEGARQAVAAQVAVGRYPAVIFSADPDHFGIRFGKIPEKVGTTQYMDPTMPVRGSQLMVVEKGWDEGNVRYEAYDPRHAALLSNETPQKAYRAIVWESMKRVYAYRFGMWEKLNTLLAAGGIFAMFILAAMLIDTLGKIHH